MKPRPVYVRQSEYEPFVVYRPIKRFDREWNPNDTWAFTFFSYKKAEKFVKSEGQAQRFEEDDEDYLRVVYPIMLIIEEVEFQNGKPVAVKSQWFFDRFGNPITDAVDDPLISRVIECFSK